MKISEINEIINRRIKYDVYEVSRKMIKDSENKIKLCSCNLDINKVKGICATIEKSKKRQVSIDQHYILSFFVSENINQYGEITDEVSIIKLFHQILPS